MAKNICMFHIKSCILFVQLCQFYQCFIQLSVGNGFLLATIEVIKLWEVSFIPQ